MAVEGPTLDELRDWLGLDASDTTDDIVLAEALAAALAAQAATVAYPVDTNGDEIMPDDLHQAVLLRAQRYAARRNSPEGVVGLSGIGGEFVGARLSSTDPDIVRLEGPWARVVVA